MCDLFDEEQLEETGWVALRQLLQAAAKMTRRSVAPQRATRLERVGIVAHLLWSTLA